MQKDRDLARNMHLARDAIFMELHKRIVGQDEIIDNMLITLFSGGHGLFVGVPGLAKTLLVQSLADVLDLRFNRIQFTPDLMPSDITGTEVLEENEQHQRTFRFVPGPVFCNILLADEINRTPPKTQAALLQSMQEMRVTSGGQTHTLERPFHVFATQNPIEQEGTYPLPEAQLDRFMMFLHVDYPTLDEETQIIARTTSQKHAALRKVLRPDEIIAYQDLVLRVPVSMPLVQQTVELVRSTRPNSAQAPQAVRDYVEYGAGPRAAQHLIMAAKARAILHGRAAVDAQDITALAVPVLQHRILLNFQAQAANITQKSLIDAILASKPELQTTPQ